MQLLLGIDEAGRGPLAGPVSVGVVRVPVGFDVAVEFPGVADSKQLSEKRREKLFEMLEERARTGDVQYRVEFESAEVIDREGIVSAVQAALDRGVRALVPDPSGAHILLDGALRAPSVYAQETIIGGDASVPLISLASVAAKVARDRLMLELAGEYPNYGFEKHKGYGTALHYEVLRKYGLSVIHRRTFIHIDESLKER